MLLMKLFGWAMVAAGVAMAAGGVVTGLVSLTLSGSFVAVGGIGLLVLDRKLAPVMQSSRAIAEQSGMQVGRLVGAPKLGPSMATARETIARTQQQMTALMGNASLRNSGVPGRAVVKAARDTGLKHNLNPVYQVDLVVTPDDGRAFEATVETEVSTLAIAQCVPGTDVAVIIDRDDHHQVWIDWMAVAGGGGRPA